MPPPTQTEPRAAAGPGRLLASPALLAAVVTLANAAKPAVVDDAAYLAFARHIAARPLDPYGFELFWYNEFEPATEILCPPVVPYWLAAGVAAFGEHVGLLKLTLFPFLWLLAWALRELLRRFARGAGPTALPLLTLSPAVLPTVNLMLDVPAAALGLGALAVLLRGGAAGAAGAGVLAALAMQAKYTALLVPPLLLWCGLTHRRLGPAAVAAGLAVALFVGWEAWVAARYGESHFLHQLRYQRAAGGAAGWLADKADLVPGLTGHLGLLAVGVWAYAARPLGVPRLVLVGAVSFWALGAVVVSLLPGRAAVLVPGKLTLPMLVWRTSGAAALLAGLGCALVLLLRRSRARPVRASASSLFLVGWVLAELAAYFVLTPFPAARRVIGVTLALGVLAARLAGRAGRLGRRPPRWVLPFGVAAGLLAAALDAVDAIPEKVLAERAAAVAAARDPAAAVWYSGHWGFQFYCERAGMRPFVVGRSEAEVRPGDLLVLPQFPDADGFHRPYPGRHAVWPPAGAAEPVAVLEWDDPLPARTVPNFYGGEDPVQGRDGPRLRVVVFRAVRRW